MPKEQFAQITLNRFTTVHDRYQICCDYCGYVRSETNFKSAVFTAKMEAERHISFGERITIYDLMAHRGKPNLWDAQGNILERKNDASR